MPFAPMSPLGLAVVEAGRMVMNFRTDFRDLRKSRSNIAVMRRTGGRLARHAPRPLGAEDEHARVDAHGHFRRVAGAGEAFSTSPTRIGSGSVRWKPVCPSSFGLCAMWSSAAATKSTGTMLMRAALDADHWHPRRQRLAQLLEQGEEVVRAVDLVDLAGLRMPDHHAGR